VNSLINEMDALTKMKALLKSNPDLLESLKNDHSENAPVKNSKVPKHGQAIALQSTSPVQISLKEAKRIMKENRKPRKPVSEEQKARMIANLAKGRETLKRRRESLKQDINPTTTFQIKPKQSRDIKPSDKPQVSNLSKDEDADYAEYLNLKKKQAALAAITAKKNNVKSTSGAFY
jgi:hypothetical protein